MTTIQTIDELEKFYKQNDPWQYETIPDDQKRKEILLSEIPNKSYKKVIDIGCGQGFITRNLPGSKVVGVDISSNAIERAKIQQTNRIDFICASIFELSKIFTQEFDLILITGVLYSQYIGESHNLVYRIIDGLLLDNGILVCCHINSWYTARFPYLMLESSFFKYREYTQRLEVYIK